MGCYELEIAVLDYDGDCNDDDDDDDDDNVVVVVIVVVAKMRDQGSNKFLMNIIIHPSASVTRAHLSPRMACLQRTRHSVAPPL